MNLICISCPKGCHLNVEKIGEEIKVSGNSCPRGEVYAINETLNPLRTLTTTIGIESENYRRLPVISSAPLPKGKIMDVMRALKDLNVKAPVRMNDVIVSDILGLGADIIASKSIER